LTICTEGELQIVDTNSEYELPFEDPKNDPRLDEACFLMLETAEATRNPSDQIIVGREGGTLAAVIHFVEPGRGEEYADLLERVEIEIALAEDEGQPRIPLEQVMAELGLE
jgi:hypothetical protein